MPASNQSKLIMRSSIIYVAMTAHLTLVSSFSNHQIYRRQESIDQDEVDLASLYLWQICEPTTWILLGNQSYEGNLFPHLASSPFPCEQQNFIFGSCMANGTDPSIDFAAEQQCLCGSNLLDAMEGCTACYVAHGSPLTNTTYDKVFISSLINAECTPSPYPTIPFFNYLNIQPIQTSATTLPPRITLGEDKFPNQTAVTNYWTTNVHVTPTLGVITGSATGRATERTEPFEQYTPPSGSSSTGSSSGTGVVTSSAGTTPAPSGSVSGTGSSSAGGVSTSLSTAGAGDMGVASGVVLVVVNVVAVMLL